MKPQKGKDVNFGRVLGSVLLSFCAMQVTLDSHKSSFSKVTLANLAFAEGAQDPQTLTIGLDVRPKTSDPRLVGTDAQSQYLEELRFLSLFSFDENGKTIPVLAESLHWDSPKTLRIVLRTDLNFASGKKITIEDVLANYNFLQNSPTTFPPVPRKGIMKDVEKVEKKSEKEIVFHLKTIDASLPTNLVIPILPKEALTAAPEELTGKGFESGPFLLKSSSDQEWILVRNDKFRGAGLLKIPKIKTLVFKIITDNTTRYAALVKGDLDLVQNNIDADKIVSLEKTEKNKFVFHRRLAMSTSSLAFNCKDPILAKENVRKAIGHAVKVDDILKYILQGFGVQAKGMFPPQFEFALNSLRSLEYDLAKAKKMLDDSGYPDPDGDGPKSRFSLVLKTSVNKERIAIAKTIAGQLKKIGVDLQVEVLESQLFFSQIAEGKGQIWINNWLGMKDPDHLHFVFHSSNFPPNGGNRGYFSDTGIDTLLDQGRKEFDQKKRFEIYKQAQEKLDDKSPYLHLWHKENYAVTAKNVTGYKIYSDGRYVSLTEVEKR